MWYWERKSESPKYNILRQLFSDMVHRSRYKNAVQPYTWCSKVEYYLLLNWKNCNMLICFFLSGTIIWLHYLICLSTKSHMCFSLGITIHCDDWRVCHLLWNAFLKAVNEIDQSQNKFCSISVSIQPWSWNKLVLAVGWTQNKQAKGVWECNSV